jgi:hypothetical protein
LSVQEISLSYEARPQFRPFHRRKQRFAVVVAHRRAGKTVAAIYDLVDAALRCAKPDGRFAYVAPYYAQAKDVVWTYLKRAMAPIPGTTINESELRVDLPNGSRIRLYGADNYDRLRGIYLDGVVLDEYADMPPAAWSEVIRPALADRQGWAVFIGTPKGRNAFADVYEKAVSLPDEWFALRLKASETGIIPPSELAALKLELSRNEYQREFETDFDAAIEGAYFADHLEEARRENRVCRLSRDKMFRLRAFWDIGGTGAKADASAVWVGQFVNREIRWLAYKEGRGQELSYYVNWFDRMGWGPKDVDMWLPHDAAAGEKVIATSYENALRSLGFKTTVVPNQGTGAAMKRVEAARRLFPMMWFDEEQCKPGIAALQAYHEKRDEKRNVGLGPEHDWASHGADAFGLGAICYEPPRSNLRPVQTPNFGAV